MLVPPLATAGTGFVARFDRSCYGGYENVHIPDGFLATPVWATLDAVAAPTVVYVARRAQRGFEESQAPLLGVMGAFVFAAQMINFPVGVGTSGHLVGGALLAYTLGPAAAAVVMTAILAIQALVFQDGGLLALGPNIVNMALLGVLAAYLPFHFWGNSRWRRPAIFLGAALSVLVSAVLALSELLISGVSMPGAVLGISLALFAVSAALEGAITLAVIAALEAMNPNFVRRPERNGSYTLGAVAAAAILLAVVGVLFASTHPDGIQKLALDVGLASHARELLHTPLTSYEAAFLGPEWLRKAVGGLTGLALVFGACMLFGRLVARNRSA